MEERSKKVQDGHSPNYVGKQYDELHCVHQMNPDRIKELWESCKPKSLLGQKSAVFYSGTKEGFLNVFEELKKSSPSFVEQHQRRNTQPGKLKAKLPMKQQVIDVHNRIFNYSILENKKVEYIFLCSVIEEFK